MKKQYLYNLELKCGQCRSQIRLHLLCSLILFYTVHKSFLCLQTVLCCCCILTLKEQTLENIVGKGENAVSQHISFSHHVFFTFKDKSHYLSHIQLNTFAFYMDESMDYPCCMLLLHVCAT